MHTIRSRRFSSVRFWHLVVLFVLVCGQLSTRVVAAQTTPEPDAFITTDECLMPSASPTDQLTHNQLWLSSLSTPRLYEFEAQSTLVTCSSEEQETAVKKSPSNAKISGAKQQSVPELMLAQMPSSAQVPNSVQMPTPVPLPALVPMATPVPQMLVLTASPSSTTAQILAPVRPARPKVKKAVPSPSPVAKPAVSSITAPTDAPTVANAKPASEPVNTTVPTPVAPADLESLFQQHAATHGVNPSIMKKIAQCESGMRAEAANGPYGGMFQFNSSTWVSNRKAMGKDPNPSLRYNAAEAIETAAFKMGRDGYGAWPSCSRKALASI